MADFHFREAKREDIKQLAQLAHELNLYHGFDTTPVEEKLLADWGRFNAFVLEGPRSDIVGFVSGYETYQFHKALVGFEIQNLYVSDRYRRKGIGKKILLEVLCRKHEQGVQVFTIVVLKANQHAAAFYRSCGFVMKDCGELYLGKIADSNLKDFLGSAN